MYFGIHVDNGQNGRADRGERIGHGTHNQCEAGAREGEDEGRHGNGIKYIDDSLQIDVPYLESFELSKMFLLAVFDSAESPSDHGHLRDKVLCWFHDLFIGRYQGKRLKGE